MLKHLTALSLATAIACATSIAPVLADSTKPLRTMTMTGHSTVKSAPDMAAVTIGVVREAKTAGAALTANNQAMSEVMQSLKSAGIAEKDIQTSGFSVQPKYIYPKRSSTGEQKPPRIVGYTVSNMVTVAVRELDNLGIVLDTVVKAGSKPDPRRQFFNCRARTAAQSGPQARNSQCPGQGRTIRRSGRRQPGQHPLDQRTQCPAPAPASAAQGPRNGHGSSRRRPHRPGRTGD